MRCLKIHSKIKFFRKIHQKSPGFSLIEILLVVSLMAMVGLSIYSAFSTGLKVWERGKYFGTEEDIAIFFDHISEELRNSFRFSRIPFYGRSQRIAFPTVVNILPNSRMSFAENSYISQIGRVEYEFDVLRDQFLKREADYGQALQGKYSEKGVILKSIRKIEFKYYFPGEKGELLSTQIADQLPAVVAIEIEYLDQSGAAQKITRMVNIPLGFFEETQHDEPS